MGRPGHIPRFSIVVPTVSGREYWLARFLRSIYDTTPDFDIHVYKDLKTCTAGWNLGLEEATGDYILLAADDLEAHRGWWQAGVKALKRNILPCPRILNSDGSLQSCGTFAEEAENDTPSVVARIPFLTRHMAEVMYPIWDRHYLSDHWITWRGGQLGWPTLVVRSMLFTHHFAPEGRKDTFADDAKEFKRVTGIK